MTCDVEHPPAAPDRRRHRLLRLGDAARAAAAPAARPRRDPRRRSPTAPSTRSSAITRRSTKTPSTCRSPRPSPARPGSSCCSARRSSGARRRRLGLARNAGGGDQPAGRGARARSMPARRPAARAACAKARWPTSACSRPTSRGRSTPTTLASRSHHTPFARPRDAGPRALHAGRRPRRLRSAAASDGRDGTPRASAAPARRRAGCCACGRPRPARPGDRPVRASRRSTRRRGTSAIRWWSTKMLAVLGIALRARRRAARRRRACSPPITSPGSTSWRSTPSCREARFVSKADVKAWPLVSRLVDSAGTLYLERERKRDALRVVHAVADALAAGQVVAIFPRARPRPATACCRSMPTCCRRRSRPATPVQPVALRFSDAADAVSEAVEFVGATSLLQSLWRTACGDGVRVRAARSCRRAPSAGVDRRALAAQLRADIAGALGVGDGSRRLARLRLRGRPRPPPSPPPRRRRGSSCGSASARRRARRRAGCRSGC